jgi:hypothetical protein
MQLFQNLIYWDPTKQILDLYSKITLSDTEIEDALLWTLNVKAFNSFTELLYKTQRHQDQTLLLRLLHKQLDRGLDKPPKILIQLAHIRWDLYLKIVSLGYAEWIKCIEGFFQRSPHERSIRQSIFVRTHLQPKTIFQKMDSDQQSIILSNAMDHPSLIRVLLKLNCLSLDVQNTLVKELLQKREVEYTSLIAFYIRYTFDKQLNWDEIITTQTIPVTLVQYFFPIWKICQQNQLTYKLPLRIWSKILDIHNGTKVIEELVMFHLIELPNAATWKFLIPQLHFVDSYTSFLTYLHQHSSVFQLSILPYISKRNWSNFQLPLFYHCCQNRQWKLALQLFKWDKTIVIKDTHVCPIVKWCLKHLDGLQLLKYSLLDKRVQFTKFDIVNSYLRGFYSITDMFLSQASCEQLMFFDKINPDKNLLSVDYQLKT